MSGAEMTIRLVDGTEAEQAAFKRGPDDHEPNNGVPSVGGVESPNSQRSDTVEAIAAGFANITDKEAKNDSQHDTTATVAGVHEQLAEIANGAKADKPTHQQGDPGEAKAEGPTTEDYRGLRVSLEQLVQRFTPKFFSEPMDRLIAALKPTESKTANREATAGAELPTQTTGDKTPIIPAVGHVNPKQEDASKPTADGKPATVPAVGHVEPKQDDKQAGAPKPIGIGDIVSKVQQHIAKIPIVGKRFNRAINSVRATVNKVQGRFQKASKFVKSSLSRTKVGRSVMAAGSKLAGKIKNGVIGQAASKVGQSVVGFAARAAGVSAVSSATAAASGGAPVAAAAPLLANPVGLAVGAVVASFAALALSAKALNDTFTSEADRLENYSPDIAIARGNQQVNTELNMLDRANKLGGPLGSLETSKAKLNDQMEKLWTEVLVELSKLAPVVKMGVDFLSIMAAEARKAIADAQVGAAKSAGTVAALTASPFDDIIVAELLKAATDNLKKIEDQQKEAASRIDGNDPNGADDPFLTSLLSVRFR